MARIDYQLATDTFEDLKGKTPDDTTSLCDFMSRKGMELTIMQAHKLMEFLSLPPTGWFMPSRPVARRSMFSPAYGITRISMLRACSSTSMPSAM